MPGEPSNVHSRSGNAPSFIIIGAQRAGTTWLHRVLSEHPDVWMTPIKEIHYFDRPSFTPGALRSRERVRLDFWNVRRWRTNPLWRLHFWFGVRTPSWYRRLFAQGTRARRITGESTPDYSAMGEPQWRHLKSVAPDTRLVFVMRDPLDRTWSQINNRFKKNRLPRDLGIDGLIQVARSENVRLRSDYARTVALVDSQFDASQVHYCFFDDLVTDPGHFVADVCRFVGADPTLIDAARLPLAVNSAARDNLAPLSFQRALASEYVEMLDPVARRFGRIPQTWIQRYEGILSKPLSGKTPESIAAAAGSPADRPHP